MYSIIPPKVELTIDQLDQLAERFKAIRHPGDLAALLKADAAQLKKLATKPHYSVFSIPKPGGARRVIHNPYPDLKEVQQALNLYLQAAYYQLKPPAAYGFIPRPNDEPRPRNIYTNALVHANSEWVLNLDMADFFHTVTTRHLGWIYRQLFEFQEPLSNQLIAICTCNGVLPMGAPTSPVLSNLACLPLDMDLQNFAFGHDANYTRYVDDLTLSFNAHPGMEVTETIRQMVEKQGFALNEGKIKLTAKADHPEVTGLILKSPKPDVSDRFVKSLKKDIRLLRRLTSAAMMQRGIFHAFVLDKLRRSIQGQVQFLGFIRGTTGRQYRKLSAVL